MSIDVFGDGMNDDIRPVIQWVLNVRAEESIVDDHQYPMLMCDRGHLANIHESQCRIRGTFDPDQLRVVGADKRLDVDLDGGSECDLHTMGRCDFGEVAVSATVDVGHGDHMRAGRERL